MTNTNKKFPLIFIFFSLAIVLKFVFLRYTLFGTTFPLWLSFGEASFIIAIFALAEWIKKKKWKLFVYVFVNLILSILAFSCTVYYRYFQTFPTIYSFSSAGQVGALSDSIFHLIRPSYYLLFADFILVIIWFFIRKRVSVSDSTWQTIPIIIVFFVSISLTFSQLAVTKNKPIADTIYFAEQNGIMNYEYLMIYKFIKENTSSGPLSAKEKEALIEEIQTLKGITPKPTEELLYHGIAKNKNLLIVQLESFQTMFIDMVVNGQEVTPFINKLKEETLYFDNMYQQVGPGNTSDAEFMVNTSILANNYEPTTMKFGNRIFEDGLPNLLNQLDYKTMTAHANTIEFWNRRPLYQGLGFSQYFDKEFYQDEDFILFGASDQVLYEKTIPELEKLAKEGRKFYLQFVAVTSHYPYNVPEEKQYLDLPADLEGTFLGDLIQAMHYVDTTVEYLVTTLKENGLWNDTLFVMYGDHSAIQPSETFEEYTPKLNEILDTTLDNTNRFKIPLFIHDSALEPQTISTLVGQIDIMPTIANLLGLDLSHVVTFGQDVLNYPDNTLGYRYYVPTGSFITEEFYFQPKSGFEDGTAISLIDHSRTVDFTPFEDTYNRMLKLYYLSDRYLLSLPLQDIEEETDQRTQ